MAYCHSAKTYPLAIAVTPSQSIRSSSQFLGAYLDDSKRVDLAGMESMRVTRTLSIGYSVQHAHTHA
jgi:hypothetical protein